MRDKALSEEAEYVWSDAHLIDACAFAERMPHVKGFEGHIVLEPVQVWWMAGIFAFREAETGLRWVRNASLWVPRKNGKTSVAAPILLFVSLCEGEVGAEATISAGSEKQANIPYNIIRAMFREMPEFCEFYRVHDTRDGTDFRATGGKINIATAKASNLDGYNPSIVLAEELHAQSQEVIGVLKTAMGSRRAPLFLSISTAGRDATAAAFDDWRASLAILEGRLKADRTFTVIYTGSKEDVDRKFDLATIEKLNPMWGVSLNPVSIEEEIAEARKSEAKLQEYKRTRLNVWSRAAGNLISVEAWNRCEDLALKLEAFRGYPIFCGIDLASRSDLNAAVFLTIVDEKVYIVGKYWLPKEADRMSDDRFADSFFAWSEDPNGWLTLTPGNYIDFRVVLADVLATLEGHNVIAVAVDDYQANLLAKEIEDKGYPVFLVKKNAFTLTPSTEDIIARVNDPELFAHDGNPVTTWCAGNVVGHYDHNDNVLPRKEKKGSRANIDGVDALVMANALRIDWQAGVLGLNKKEREMPNPYLQRGLAGSAA